MQIHANTPTFYANPCKYSRFLCKSMQILSFFMQMHANTLVFYANACKYSRFLCKSMQIRLLFMQIHANTLVFYANPCKSMQIQSFFMQILANMLTSFANTCKYCCLLCKYKRFFMQMHFLLKTQHYANAPGFGLKGAKDPFYAQMVKQSFEIF